MKKLLLIFAIISVLIACNDSGSSSDSNKGNCTDCDTDTLTTAELAALPTYKKEYVQEMVNYYYTLPKTNANIVVWIPLPNPPVRKLLKNRQSLVIIVGAYLTDTLGRKKGDRAVVVQLKTSGKYLYYDYSGVFPSADSITHKGICPPPDNIPCPIEAHATQ